ncbi:TerC family protein [Paenibacillus sp. JCM 10914]|uniref:TerC family protein n=1 Tax=Paenibacillus sp. JCM 10914 TaxID=1236974 RepID=UPI0003CC2E52|nr:TerC family protein [Paenibacillus sp. JCM 10914]GAE04222.1 integral membrane protein TerC [Paenibacillus sp. JCM 10914]
METILLLGQILLINLVLSGDNALVIAMASRDLPDVHRKRAVWIGTVGAVLLRCILTFAAVLLLKIPFLQACGALLLMWIAIKLMMQNEHENVALNRSLTIWAAVNTILIADFVMSLDNVLAIAGLAQGDLALIVIGILLSIPIVVWGSGLISKLLRKFPVLLYIGAGILALTAGEMLVSDSRVGLLLVYWMPQSHQLLPLLIAIAVMLIGGLQTIRRPRI